MRPDDQVLCGALQLYLAGQRLFVRMVHNTGGDLGPLLERLHAEVLHELILEQYIVMVDFAAEDVARYRRAFSGVTTRRVHVGSLQSFLAWLPARLGPLAALPLTSPVRALTEHMLCVSACPEQLTKVPLVLPKRKTSIDKSFDFGALGVQAVGTLFSFSRGEHFVRNVEDDPAWQKEDVDLLINESGLGGRRLKVEVKNEKHTAGNLSLEIYGNYERRTPGWFCFSTADVLATCLWATGDLILMDFDAVLGWAVNPPRGPLKVVPGRAPGQDYTSRLFLAKADHLLADLPGVVHLRIADWLPALYGKLFPTTSQVLATLGRKTLRPQRLQPWS